jgi:hypothetical protein
MWAMDRRSSHSPWFDVGWPLLAGTVTAVGLIAAYLWMGLVTTAIALALLELTVAPVAWSILSELDYPTHEVILRISPIAAVGGLSLVGLVSAFSGWSLVMAAVVVMTSPLVKGWSRVGTRGMLVRYGVNSRTETRRRFDDIVAHGFPTLPDDDLPPR